MSRIKYSKEALERIGHLDRDEVIAFMDGVSRSLLTQIFQALPPLPGFRRKSAGGVARYETELASRLTGRKIQPKDEAETDAFVLGQVWRAWGLSHLGDDQLVNDYFDERFPKRSDTESDPEGAIVTDHDVEIAERLKELTFANRCSRDDVREFFLFGPFPESKEIGQIIEACKSTEDVERDQALRTVPQRLTDIEERLRSVGLGQQTNDARMTELEHSIELTNAAVATLSERQSELEATLATIQGHIQEVKSRAQTSDSSRDNLYVRQAQLENAVQELQAAIKNASDADSGLASAVDQLGETQAHIRAELEAKLEALTSSFSSSESALSPTTSAEVEVSNISSNNRSEIDISVQPLLGATDRTPPISNDLYETTDTLATNFQLAGIRPTDALSLAREIMAALMTGQAVLFSGCYANVVAKLCARTFAEEASYGAEVPVGLLESAKFNTLMERVRARHKGIQAAIVFDGVNNSAFESYGRGLREALFAIRHEEGRRIAYPFIFGSIVNGPAALPVSEYYFDVAAVFDSDVLAWRKSSRPASEFTYRQITTKKWLEWVERAKQLKGREVGVSDLMESYEGQLSPIFRNNLASVSNALTGIFDEDSGKSLESIIFGWVVPYLLARGKTTEDAAVIIGNLVEDRESLDQRIRKQIRGS